MWRKSYSLFALLLLFSGCALQPLQSPHSEKQPEQVAIQLELGLTYLEQERLDLAQGALQKALSAIGPQAQLVGAEVGQWQQIHYGLALIYLRKEVYQRSEHHFMQALVLESPYPEAANGYGVLLCRQGRRAEAELQFQRAINNPQYRTPEVAMNNRKACGEEQR
jgi:type IV pilus assembly protein PilF